MAWAAADIEPIVSVRNVFYSYGTIPVLVDIDLDIHGQDFLAVIGPNGAGKTTLLKIILGLLKPSRGQVLLLGKPQEEFREWAEIGYIPQKAAYFDPLFPASVREVVDMAIASPRNLRRFGRDPGREEAIRHALRVVGMMDLVNRRIGSLSGGQQQRVFIARAIVNRPRILFLDEPTTGVDAETQEHFYDLLDALNKNEGITIVLVTHDIGIVNRHVSQVACLNQKMVYHGSHAEFCSSAAMKELLAGGDHLVSHRH
jgi:zinc transport system ATP-binding protein